MGEGMGTSSSGMSEEEEEEEEEEGMVGVCVCWKEGVEKSLSP